MCPSRSPSCSFLFRMVAYQLSQPNPCVQGKAGHHTRIRTHTHTHKTMFSFFGGLFPSFFFYLKYFLPSCFIAAKMTILTTSFPCSIFYFFPFFFVCVLGACQDIYLQTSFTMAILCRQVETRTERQSSSKRERSRLNKKIKIKKWKGCGFMRLHKSFDFM